MMGEEALGGSGSSGTTANVCERRIMAQEKVPIAEKIISLSDVVQTRAINLTKMIESVGHSVLGVLRRDERNGNTSSIRKSTTNVTPAIAPGVLELTACQLQQPERMRASPSNG
jgi:hypothetical protein